MRRPRGLPQLQARSGVLARLRGFSPDLELRQGLCASWFETMSDMTETRPNERERRLGGLPIRRVEA
jgi:hypothetical protein